MTKDKMFDSKYIYHVYQPIFNLNNWGVHGYEALLRNSKFQNTEEIFRKARKVGKLYELDTYSISNAISSFEFSNNSLLFLNVFPSTLVQTSFQRYLRDLHLKLFFPIHRIVFELNETVIEEELWGRSEFVNAVSALQNEGYKIALDDIGKGALTLHKAIELNPDFMKIDRYYADKLAESKVKQETIYKIQKMCNENINIVLEGIEREVDLAFAKVLKVSFGQGYLIGKPKTLKEM
jgi:EAL domain-containing protein (putative c-di-GMP-specific phosphodiesterase class I)